MLGNSEYFAALVDKSRNSLVYFWVRAVASSEKEMALNPFDLVYLESIAEALIF